MGSDLLMACAQKIAGQGNNNGFGSVITDGSIILVGEGECAIATEGGKIIGVYDQPGEQIFRSNQSSGIFSGGIGSFIKDDADIYKIENYIKSLHVLCNATHANALYRSINLNNEKHYYSFSKLKFRIKL